MLFAVALQSKVNNIHAQALYGFKSKFSANAASAQSPLSFWWADNANGYIAELKTLLHQFPKLFISCGFSHFGKFRFACIACCSSYSAL